MAHKEDDARHLRHDADPRPVKPARTLDLSFVVTPSLCQKFCGSVAEWPTRCGKEGNDMRRTFKIMLIAGVIATIGGVIYITGEALWDKGNAVGPGQRAASTVSTGC